MLLIAENVKWKQTNKELAITHTPPLPCSLDAVHPPEIPVLHHDLFWSQRIF
jgi:hypothetical protein